MHPAVDFSSSALGGPADRAGGGAAAGERRHCLDNRRPKIADSVDNSSLRELQGGESVDKTSWRSIKILAVYP